MARRYHPPRHVFTESPPSAADPPNVPGPAVVSVPEALLLGLIACAVVLFFFCPNVITWKGLWLPPASGLPEVNRAIDTLKQLNDPFVHITNLSNAVLRWRLLFPIVGHLLHLPPTLFLAIPWIGCVVTAAYLIRLTGRVLPRRRDALQATILLSSVSWFFVSTGWLSYEDSWCMLALLAVSFSASLPVLCVTTVLSPFIDERFIVTLPLVIAIRMVIAATIQPRPGRIVLQESILILASIMPYFLIGIVGNEEASHYFARRVADLHSLAPFKQYLLGWWMSLRLDWFLVAAAIGLTFRQRRFIPAVALTLAVLFSVITGMVVAADLSRSIGAALPAAVLGLFLLFRADPRKALRYLPLLTAANLLLPAANVVTIFTEPVLYFYAAIDHWDRPSQLFDPMAYFQQGQMEFSAGHIPEARLFLDWSVQLGPDLAGPRTYLALAEASANDLPRASANADVALSLDPNSADAMFTRGIIWSKQNDRAKAIDILNRAMQAAPPDWPQRGECAFVLDRLNHGATIPLVSPYRKP